MKKLIAVFVMLFASCFVSTPAIAGSAAIAGSVSVYANPHNDAKYGNGAGMSIAVAASDNLDLSLNWLDTDPRHDGKKIFDARLGVAVPVTGKLSAVAEVGYGYVYKADGDVCPVALGLKYAMADKLSLLAKGTRYFKDDAEQRVQWTVGAALGF